MQAAAAVGAGLETLVAAVRLIRTRRGKVVHRKDCVQGAKAKRWTDWAWAIDKEYWQVLEAVLEFGYHCCRKCEPMRVDDED